MHNTYHGKSPFPATCIKSWLTKKSIIILNILLPIFFRNNVTVTCFQHYINSHTLTQETGESDFHSYVNKAFINVNKKIDIVTDNDSTDKSRLTDRICFVSLERDARGRTH